MQLIRRLATPFTIHIKHVLRHLNKAPDALANKAMDAKQSLGFNPIKHLPQDDEIDIPAQSQDNVVNGVEVTPVTRPTEKAAPKTTPKPKQPSLFDDL